MNHGPPERAAWIRRFVHRLGPDRPLCFEIDKQAAGQELVEYQTETIHVGRDCEGFAT